MLIRSAPAMSDLEDESPLLAFDGLREGSNGPASGLIDTSTQRRLDSELAGPAGVQKGFLRIEGMTCAVCSGTIERALQFTDGVSSGKVSLLTETCEVLYDPAVVSVEEIMEEIQDVGFGAKVMPRSKQVCVCICVRACVCVSSESVNSM
jgi:copper chaperone CopZ